MIRNARISVTYYSPDRQVRSAWDSAAEKMLKETFNGAVFETGSGYCFFSGGRDLNYEIKRSSKVEPIEVKRALRKFFKNRHATGVEIEIYDDAKH